MTVLATGFRLFFLLAGLVAALWTPLWMQAFTDGSQLGGRLGPLGWHTHEMVFGYTGAVLAGFLLTAVRNWTGRETLRGAPLAGLLGLWLAGRVTVLYSAQLPELLPAIVDGLFFAVLVVAIGRPIIAARSWRNAGFPVLVLLIGCCDVVIHLHALGRLPLWSSRALGIALDCIVVILIVFAGRILPLFTRKATKAATRQRGFIDRLGIILVTASLLINAARPGHQIANLVLVITGLVNGARLYGWGGSKTLGQPILWVLHVGWLLLTAGLVLRGLNGLLIFSVPSGWTHLIAVGGIGVLTIGMMSRVALGHTGRPLVAAGKVALAFGSILIAVVARVLAPLLPQYYVPLLWLATATWAAAFALFTLHYASILLTPRADGKPG